MNYKGGSLIMSLILVTRTIKIHSSLIYNTAMKFWKLQKRTVNHQILLIPTNTRLVVSFPLSERLLQTLNVIVADLPLQLIQVLFLPQENTRVNKKTQKIVKKRRKWFYAGFLCLKILSHTIKKRLTVYLAIIYHNCIKNFKIAQNLKNTFITSQI